MSKDKSVNSGKITHGIAFKFILFFVFAISCFTAFISICGIIGMVSMGAYTRSHNDYIRSYILGTVYDHIGQICYDRDAYASIKDITNALETESQTCNLEFSLVKQKDAKVYWSNVSDGADYGISYEYYFYRETDYNADLRKNVDVQYRLNVFVDETMSKQDDIRYKYEEAQQIFNYRYVLIWGAAIGCILALICFIWLICNVGHRRGKEGITPGELSDIYIDMLTVFFAAGAMIMFIISVELFYLRGDIVEFILSSVVFSALCTVNSVWCTIYCREFALRVKLGKWWQHSLIYVICRFAVRMVRKLFHAFMRFATGFHMIVPVSVIVVFLSACEFFCIGWWGGRRTHVLFICWIFEKIIVIPAILYCALAFQKLRAGSRALAQGDLSVKFNLDYLILGFKEHGENLNKIGEGISKAVEQRLQSERLKTELITNVSHDLKTPLTSVINYADILGSTASGMTASENDDVHKKEQIESIKEYSEVLLRQSARLRRLLDDLVEASKAATGNLEINSEPCELGVLLTQAAGEYETKFQERSLELKMSKPGEAVRIMADGRHLWRVFDNLMSNICKYAQQGSRVYLNMETTDKNVRVIFRNMSNYELNIPADELVERFVRGDSSRHLEGSGLGLSITRSLVEMQHGKMEIITDGDLFKVILEFPVLD